MVTNTHPTLPEFDYIKPVTLSEASEFLFQHANNARPFLGGTDIFVRMRDGFIKPEFLVDIKHLDGTSEFNFDPQKGLTIGATVNMNQVIRSPDVQEHYPLLVDACRSVASYQLRNRATIVGNICNASPAGDTIGACIALDGMLHIFSIAGSRLEPINEFFLGPGKTTLKSGDIVTAISFPLPPQGCVGAYYKLGRNKSGDLSIVGITVLGNPDSKNPSGFRFRIVLASVAPVPLIVSLAETFLATHNVNPETIHQAACITSEASHPIDDVQGSARYRKEMVKYFTENLLSEVWKKLKIVSPRI
jgi:carbon-monoxide dehydrogenase medium subunit